MGILNEARYAVGGAFLLCALTGIGQTRTPQPVTDSAAQASPSGPVLDTPATDASAEASPTDAEHRGKGKSFGAHTTLRVVLTDGIDSGNLKNGQMVHGKLQPGAGVGNKPGTPVLLTVVGTVPAGKLNAAGEISLEVVRVGGQSVATNVLTFRGRPGHRDLPDSAPMVGTNAGLPAGTALVFTVQPPPSFAEPRPRTDGDVPGSVTQHVSGSKPPNYGQPVVSSAAGAGSGAGAGKNNAPVATGGGTPQPVGNSNAGTAAPNQMTAPTNASPTATTPR